MCMAIWVKRHSEGEFYWNMRLVYLAKQKLTLVIRLRRALPVTRQKIDWEKVGGYNLGSDIGKATA